MNIEEVSNKARELLKSYNNDQVEKLINLVLKEDFTINELVKNLDFKI